MRPRIRGASFFMRRYVLPIISLLLALLALIPLLTIQPAGMARVTRSRNRVFVGEHRVAWRARFGRSCLVPLQSGRLYFNRPIEVASKGGDAVGVRTAFLYDPPGTLPAPWPAGDWCESLHEWVRQRLTLAVREFPAERILEDPRKASDSISSSLRRDLQDVAFRTSSVSVRFELPPGWERTRPVPEIARLARLSNPVIFVGLDGADWELLDDLIASGSMPNLRRLVTEGASGIVTTEHPPLSPLVWTTMMTGVSPLEHQILDFTRYNPVTSNKEPITTDERKAPAIWNMATMAGRRVAVMGLWATYPAEPVRGLMVSDRLFTFLFSESSPPPGVVYPPARERWARDHVKAAEEAVNFDALRAYLPWLNRAAYEALLHEPDPYSEPGSALRRILVETEVYHRLATDLLSASTPDLTIVYLQGTDTVGHVFAPFAPPKQSEVSQADYDRYHEVPELYFQRVDRALGDIIKAAESVHGTVMLASDHGFHWKEGRPVTLSSFATATAAKWHRNDGIYLVWGPRIQPSKGHTGRGTIRQVCSTLLALTGLPAARGTAESTLTPVGASQATVDYKRYFQSFVPSARTVAGTQGAGEALAKLRALGYIGSGESVAPRPSSAGTSTRTAGAYNNEGLILKHEGRIAEAIASFDRALTIDPKLASAAWNLSDLLFERRHDLLRSDELLIRAVGGGLPHAPRYVIERAMKYQKSGHGDRSLTLLEAAVSARPDDAELRMFRGRYRVEQQDCAGALEDFRVAQQIRPNDAIAWASAGLAEICLGNHAEAQAYFRRSLELNPNQPVIQKFLAP